MLNRLGLDQIFIALPCAFLAVACSNGPQNSSTTVGQSISTSSTTYQYRYDETLNGVSCTTHEHTFSSRDEYCSALTDSALNQDCALELRKQAYEKDCGSNFEETNVAASFEEHGYDTRLGSHCSTARPPVMRFRRAQDFCEFLRDETLHRGCFWPQRKRKFEKLGCASEFSPEPEMLRQPTLPSETDDRPLSVRDIQTAGIAFGIDSSGSFSGPHARPFQDRLQEFWPVLYSISSEIVDRKSRIQTLVIADHASYDEGTLALNVDFNAGEVRAYLRLLDRRFAWQEQTGIQLSTGVDVAGTPEGDKLRSLTQKIERLEASQEAAKHVLWPSVKSLKFGDTATYLLESRELTLSNVRFTDELSRLCSAHSPLAASSALIPWAESLSIEVGGDMDAVKLTDRFAAAFKLLQNKRASLESLSVNAGLKRLSLRSQETHLSFNLDLGELIFPGANPSPESTGPLLDGLSEQYQKAAELGIPVLSRLPALDAHYLETLKRLKAFVPAITAKKAAIREIDLGAISNYSAPVLTVGYAGTPEDLGKVLTQLQAPAR